MKKIMIQLPIVYSIYSSIDIDIESIKNILTLSETRNEESKTYIKTTHGNYDTHLSKEQITRAIDAAILKAENGQKGYVVVNAEDTLN